MKFPDYPSNREADEMVKATVFKMGRRQSRMKLSRETCYTLILLGLGNYYASRYVLRIEAAPHSLGEQLFLYSFSHLFIYII
jgi:hypothetical protein